MSRYGRRLTKQDLMDAGITEITTDGKVFRGEIELNLITNAKGYKNIYIYDRDENGNMIKVIPKNATPGQYAYKTRVIGLHRAMWAWFYDEVPEGMVIDHINNKHEELSDYNLNNLQILTPAQNLEKEKGKSNRVMKCKLNKSREFYEEKLNELIKSYEKAKAHQDAKAAHKLRTEIANYKARLRYWDENTKSH